MLKRILVGRGCGESFLKNPNKNESFLKNPNKNKKV
jgi:hypothetical protein